MKTFVYFLLCLPLSAKSQSVGIGTSAPNPKAALHIQSANQGVLFPRLTSAQRNAIGNPPNGLHIFNTDERCLNYYDSLFAVWNCYCDNDTCKQVTITLPRGCNINFQTTYASKFPGVTKFHIRINAGDTIYGCGSALDFSAVTSPMVIHIINAGVIIGQGGTGGNGATGHAGSCVRTGGNGGAGGNAITTSLLATIRVNNYGFIIAGGGGGGGGGNGGVNGGVYGGGGGAGAGFSVGTGGNGGGTTFSGPFGSCGTTTPIATAGGNGTITGFGIGGNGANGGGKGGDGAGLGLAGKNGTGTNSGLGGAAGKAIGGGSGNSIINHGGAQVTGAID